MLRIANCVSHGQNPTTLPSSQTRYLACLYDGAGLLSTSRLRDRHENSPDGLVKDVLEAFLCKRRTFEVPNAVNLLAALDSLRVGDGRHPLLAEGSDGLGIVAQIQLGADKDDWDVRGMMRDLGVPLGENIVERGGADDRETDQEDVRLGVGERTETIIILLSGGIPQAQADRLVVDHNVCGVIVENGWDVLAREGIGGVRDQETRLSDGSVTGNNALKRASGGHARSGGVIS